MLYVFVIIPLICKIIIYVVLLCMFYLFVVSLGSVSVIHECNYHFIQPSKLVLCFIFSSLYIKIVE